MNKLTGNPRHQIHNAIMLYINEKLPWACLNLNLGSKGDQYVCLKNLPKSMVNDLVVQMAKQAKQPTYEQLSAAIWNFADFYYHCGKNYPEFLIGPIHLSNGLDYTTLVRVNYNGPSLDLDYAKPFFFEQLDAVLAWIMDHNDLSGLSLPHQSAPY